MNDTRWSVQKKNYRSGPGALTLAKIDREWYSKVLFNSLLMDQIAKWKCQNSILVFRLETRKALLVHLFACFALIYVFFSF